MMTPIVLRSARVSAAFEGRAVGFLRDVLSASVWIPVRDATSDIPRPLP